MTAPASGKLVVVHFLISTFHPVWAAVSVVNVRD
ncbi:hypothetical protein EDD31_1714 [Bogoriella caseilytica]|uniref:Uncharacterized protein n=1 Tax=Bogoriella caseilytica TaxID=56055 RepID=A0A3N2BDL1_9MICO|nr:hypothetical protein EDD31_1714 [Bogoriella caseilytica]